MEKQTRQNADIQRRTFTSYLNYEYFNGDLWITNLNKDLSDGSRLIHIVERVQMRKYLGTKDPLNDIQRRINIQAALDVLQKDQVKVADIDTDDIAHGEETKILNLVWNLIMRYHIPGFHVRSTTQKTLILAWLQSVIPEIELTNFHRNWNSGIALSALVDYCKPGICSDWRILSLMNAYENCKRALFLAQKHLAVPPIISAGHLNSENLDELSCITYLSYFVKKDGPGYRATLRNVQTLLSDIAITGFGKAWNDGYLLHRLIHAIGGHISNLNDINFDNSIEFMHNVRQALQSAVSDFGIVPIVGENDIVNCDDHMAIMVLCAILMRRVSSPENYQARLKNTKGNRRQYYNVNQTISFDLVFGIREIGLQDIDVVVTFDGGKHENSRNIQLHKMFQKASNTLTISFVPLIQGDYLVHILCEGKNLPGSPIHLTVTSSPLPTTSDLPQKLLNMDYIDNVSFSGLNRPCAIGSLVEAVINARGDAKPITEDITVFTLSPQRRNRENCHLAYRPSTNSYAATFVPSEVGEWQMHILHKGRHIKGSPFQCQVFDPNLVSVYGLDVGLVGQELRFTVDTSLAGEGTLKVSVIRQGRQILSYISEEKEGIYKVSFTPDGSGQYKIHITFNQLEVKGSPFLLDIADASSVSVHGDNLRMAAVGKLATFFIHAVSAESKDITVIVTGPSNKQKHAIIIPVDASTYRAEWRPNVIGEHHISVLLFEQHVAESPFTCSVGDPERVTVKIPSYLDTRKLGTVHSFEIDATLAGSGNLEIIINGGRVACRVRELSPRHFKAEFTPTQKIKHVIEMRFNGYDVVNSPWILQVRDSDSEAEGTHQPKAAKYFHEQYSELVGSGLHQTAVGQLTSFEVRSDSLKEDNVKARLSGENAMVVPVTIRQKYKSLLCEYKVPKVGDYQLEIFINGQIIDSGPLSVSAYDPSRVFIRPEAEDYSVGKPVQFVGKAVYFDALSKIDSTFSHTLRPN